MNKRRRAYKKYDWMAHSIELIDKQFKREMADRCGKYIDLVILYGKKNIEQSYEDVTLKAGLFKFTVSMPAFARKKVLSDKVNETVQLTVPSCIVPDLNPKYQRLKSPVRFNYIKIG